MRLTLRTLLAYLDDVLDPVDKEELAQKIESSEFAEDLVHRTRDTVRRLRLSAAQVIGTGMGLDPNTVAEYLDNVMSPEQVGDFERICLESDVHLAEATACHHVLTMVLGEPADVDPASRQRMYTIASEASGRPQLRMEPAHKAPAAAVAAAAPVQPMTVAAAVAQQPRGVEIPDYLRAGAWWRSSAAMMGLAAVLLIGVAILLYGLSGWFGGAPTATTLTLDTPASPSVNVAPNAVPAADPATATAGTETPANTTAASAPPTALASPPPPLTPGIALPATVATTEPDRYAANGASGDAAAPPAATDTASSSPPPVGDIAVTTPPLPGATETPAANTTVNIPSTPPVAFADPATIPPAATDPVISAPPANDLAAATPPSAGDTPVVAPADPAADASIAPPDAKVLDGPRDLGTYMGGKTVLLRHDDQAGAWFRMEPRAAVMPGQRLLSLPEFRPKLALISGVHADLSGGTQVIIGGATGTTPGQPAADPDGVPALEIVYGRVVLINPSNAESRVRLKLGSSTGEAKLAHNATLAVEVERKHVPGQDPQQSPSPVEVRLFAPDGGVVWHDLAGDKSIDKPSRWILTIAGAADIVDDPAPPEWIDHEPVVQLSEQRYGAPVIENTLVSNVPVDTQLLELFQGSGRKEVKSLVARSSTHVGLFEPFVDSLRDSEQKANWKTHIEALRAAMAVSPETAGKVWQALVDQRGRPAAKDLYEMLCGYSAAQIGHTADEMKTGALATLIDRLEEDSLDYRVLAAHDLREITGKALMLNPAASLAERTQNIRRWRSRLEAGELKPVSQP